MTAFMAPPRSRFDKPASNGIFFAIIGLSAVLGLYAILALPGTGNSNKSAWQYVKETFRGDVVVARPSRLTKTDTLTN